MRFFILMISMMTLSPTLSAQTNAPQVTVMGEGIVKVTPDRVNIKVRVEKRGEAAKEVKAGVDEAVHKVLDFLSATGLAKEDYQTDYLNLNKQTDYNTKETYYTAQQSIAIKLKDLSKYGAVMKGLMDSGINRIDGVTFEDSEVEKHRSQAREAATKDAMQKAKDYASSLGVKVGKPLFIREPSASSAPRPFLMKAASAEVAAEAYEDSPLAVGQIEIKETVEVSFALE